MPILNVQLGGEDRANDGRTIPIPPQIALTQRGPVVQVTVSIGQAIAQQILQQKGVTHGQICPFDAADYLDDEETIAEYLTAALEDPNPDVFLAAVRDVARARGMAQLAKDAGLGRESLYKALAPGAKPRYDTMLKLLHALGVKLSASPTHS